jgi:hypothetical protein
MNDQTKFAFNVIKRSCLTVGEFIIEPVVRSTDNIMAHVEDVDAVTEEEFALACLKGAGNGVAMGADLAGRTLVLISYVASPWRLALAASGVVTHAYLEERKAQRVCGTVAEAPAAQAKAA